MTVLVPHCGAHDHSLFLWNNNNLSTPVHTFLGHRWLGTMSRGSERIIVFLEM